MTLAGKYAFPVPERGRALRQGLGAGGLVRERVRGRPRGLGARGGIFPANAAASETVPIAEKFFAGGSSTARGFDTDLEGIPALPNGNDSQVTVDYNTQATLHSGTGTGILRRAVSRRCPQYDCSPGPRIVGGNGFMAWGLEYRLPIAGNLGISIFYDLAQVWATPGDIHFAIEGRDGTAPVDRRRPSLHDAHRPAASRVRPAGSAADDPVRGDVDGEPGRLALRSVAVQAGHGLDEGEGPGAAVDRVSVLAGSQR